MASLAWWAPLEDRVDFRMDGVSTLYTAAQLRGGQKRKLGSCPDISLLGSRGGPDGAQIARVGRVLPCGSNFNDVRG